MKRAVILHALEQTSQGHWYPWLRQQLESRGYEVWVPDMPHNTQPSVRETTDFLLASDWNFNDNLVIGHSWGSVQALHLMQNLPAVQKVKTAVLVSTFQKQVAEQQGWYQQLKGLFEEPFDFPRIKSQADHFLCVHGDNDPWCPLAQAQAVAEKLDSELVIVPGGQHFSTSLDPAFTQFPQLIEILEARHLL